MTDAVSAAMVAAQVVKRIMELLRQREANFAYVDDLRTRMQTLSRVCEMIQETYAGAAGKAGGGGGSGGGGGGEHELSFATDGVVDMLKELEEYVVARLEERSGGGGKGAKGKLKRLGLNIKSVLTADDIKVRLRELDEKMSRYMQVLTVASSAAQLRRQMAMEAQIERLAKLSENMFALQMLTQGLGAAGAMPGMAPMGAAPRASTMSGRYSAVSSHMHVHASMETYQPPVAATPRTLATRHVEYEDPGTFVSPHASPGRAGAAAGTAASSRSLLSGVESVESEPPSGSSSDAEAREPRPHTTRHAADEMTPGSHRATPSADDSAVETSIATATGIERRIVSVSRPGAPVSTGAAKKTGPKRGRVVLEDPPESLAEAIAMKASSSRLIEADVRMERTVANGVMDTTITSKLHTQVAVNEGPEQLAVALAAAGVAAAGGAQPMSARTLAIAQYVQIVGHQFITCSFTGALALMAQDAAARASIVLHVPLLPVISTLVVAWRVGQLHFSAAGIKPLLRTSWTIYLMYSAPCVCGIIYLALRGILSSSDANTAFLQYLVGCLIGSALFVMSHWLNN